MILDHLAYSDQRVLRLTSLSDVGIDTGTLVSIAFDNDRLVLRRENEVALVDLPNEQDCEWLQQFVPRDEYLAELLLVEHPTSFNSGEVRLRILRYDGVDRWSVPREVGVDDQTVQDVSRFRKRNYRSDEVIAWLTRQLTLETGAPVLVLSSGSGELNSAGFRVIGSNMAADIRLEKDRLLVSRVVPKPKNRDQKLILVHGQLRIVDHTRLGLVSAEARAELLRLSEAENAFYAVWDDYSKLEQKAKLTAAADIGWAEYDRFSILKDGSIEFDLVDNSHARAFVARIGEDPVGLEASLSRSYLESDRLTPKGTSRGGNRDGKGFVIGEARVTAPLVVLLEPEREISPTDLPQKGEIYGIYTTDSIRISRRGAARQELARARTIPARQLSLILAGKDPDPVGRTKNHEPISARVSHLLGGQPTPAQVEAIDLAINSKDLVLIQGPPGTGKTRVVAAIQARLAEIGRGQLAVNQRVLFASYQHDAVENLLQAADDGTLPAVKIGVRHRGVEDDAYLGAWTTDLENRLERRYRDDPSSEILGKLRHLRERAVAYTMQPFDVPGTIELLNWLSETLHIIDSEIATTAASLSQKIQRELGGGGSSRSDKIVEHLARGLRSSLESFEDDGLERARAASLSPSVRKMLDKNQRLALDEASLGADPSTASLHMEAIKLALLDGVMNHRAATNIIATRPEVKSLITRAIESIVVAARTEASDIDLAVDEFRDAVISQPGSIRWSLQTHTRALAATCQQSASGAMKLAHTGLFDTVILDEAARANPLDLMIPLSLAGERIILVGDHRQLPQLLDDELLPLLSQKHDRNIVEATLRQSMFERLFSTLKERELTDGTKRVITLDRQFRMHPVLGQFISETFYEPFGEHLENGFVDPSRFAHGLARYADAACGWIDVRVTAGKEERTGNSISRPAEAKVIVEELQNVMKDSGDLTFGVISFYSGQVEEIWRQLGVVGLATRVGRNKNEWALNDAIPWMYGSRGLPRLRVGTVDAFQGREFDVVYLSTTRSGLIDSRRPNPFGFLVLPNRLNVAMSRQRRLLITVGDSSFITSDLGRSAVPPLVAFHDLTGGPNGFRH